MINSSDFDKAIGLIDQSDKVLITSHVRPDGDACGSALAISQTLESLGKSADILMLTEVPKWYDFLFSQKVHVLSEKTSSEQFAQSPLGKPDLIIIVDTNSYSQLAVFGDFVKQSEIPVLIIDHHVTNDGLGDVELNDTTAAATGLIVYDFLNYAGWPITKEIADCIFVSTATDTGWFQFNNTDSRTFKTCGELIQAGVNPTQIYHDLYQNCSLARIKLMTAMFNTLQLHLDGRFATQHVTQDDFERTGASYNDTENFIDECRCIQTVEAAALFVQLPDGKIKCSLRSSKNIDVRKIAQKFGGGGHKMASGVHLQGPLQDAKKLIFEEITKQFAEINAK
ncbi:MAG: DHH family phosphoesterase [Planctomycetota bacterium]|jgi:phosphoesterase RecJ-like protein